MSRHTAAERAAIESRRVERVYSVLSRIYDDSFDWALGPGRRRAIGRMEIKPGERILEIGVGTGLSFLHYPKHCHVTGIDISEPMLEQARERTESLGARDVELLLMDARNLQLPDASFDHVLAPYVMSVVPEPKKVMSEICRVCKPGGRVTVVNHFRSQNPILGTVEEALTPLSQWIGFKLDVPVDSVTRIAGLSLEASQRVNLFGLWRLLEMRKDH